MEKGYKGYKFLKFTLGPIFKLYYKVKIINNDVIPTHGPIILASNHRHAFDQCLAVLATPRVIHYMTKREYFDGRASFFGKPHFIGCKVSKKIVELAGCIRVDRQIKDITASEEAIEVLNNGGAIGIFPEGTRNKTRDLLLPFKFGAVSMAKKTVAYIVPLAVTGEYKFRGKLIVTFGTPFKVDKLSLKDANEKLRKEIEFLLLNK